MNYNKKLIVQCDDTMFASGEIIISWGSDVQSKEYDGIRCCHIDFYLQCGGTAVLGVSEIDELITSLQTVRDRIDI